jgi:hypothetical protein
MPCLQQHGWEEQDDAHHVEDEEQVQRAHGVCLRVGGPWWEATQQATGPHAALIVQASTPVFEARTPPVPLRCKGHGFGTGPVAKG